MRTTQFPIYNYGELNIDETSRKVSLEDKTVNLTRTEFAILKLLVQNPGQVIAKSVLLDRISLDTPDCTENSLKTHISHLRGKLREISGKELNGLTMHIPKGSIYGFVGRNGAGKTTLIRLICGLQEPDSGSYRIYGIKNTDPQIVRGRRRMGQLWRHCLL